MSQLYYSSADYLQEVWSLRANAPNKWAMRVGLLSHDHGLVTKRVEAARKFLRSQPGYERYGRWYIRVGFTSERSYRDCGDNPPYWAQSGGPDLDENYVSFETEEAALAAAKALYDWLESVGPADIIIDKLAEEN